MKQAIEEGFIHDVLANYTTYQSYYEIQSSIEENPLFDTAKAQKKLKGFVEGHKETIAVKAEIIMEQFLTKVVNTKKLKGKAKGMVVTQSIKSAIHYFYAIQKILKDKGNPFKVAIAFSGKKTVTGIKGIDHTEDSLNNFSASLDTAKPSDPDYISDKIARYFNMDEYRILVVANKYLTGFDQPKLTTMFVDKKLQGVLAVQALSRLNRSANKWGKKTEDIFVLDFFNNTSDIQTAFTPYYTSTTLSSETDINVLHELKDALDDVGVYEWSEVEDFVIKYFTGVDAQVLSPIIDIAAARFNAELDLEDKAKADFKIKAKQFVKIYGQMASIMRYEMVVWEKLYWFLKFLIPKLQISDTTGDAVDDLLSSVDLSTYGLERTRLNETIQLDAAETELDPQNPNPRGAHGGEEEIDPLDLIIQSFNERWFQGWDATPEEQRVKFVTLARHIRDNPAFQNQVMNNPDLQNRDLALVRLIDEAIRKQRRNELEMYKKYSQDDAFRVAIQDTLRRILDVNLPPAA